MKEFVNSIKENSRTIYERKLGSQNKCEWDQISTLYTDIIKLEDIVFLGLEIYKNTKPFIKTVNRICYLIVLELCNNKIHVVDWIRNEFIKNLNGRLKTSVL